MSLPIKPFVMPVEVLSNLSRHNFHHNAIAMADFHQVPVTVSFPSGKDFTVLPSNYTAGGKDA